MGSGRKIWVFSIFMLFAPACYGQNLATSSLNSDVERAKPWMAQWKFAMGGISFSEGQDEGAAAFSKFSLKFDYKFNTWIRAHIEPEAEFFSSRVQERYDNGTYESKLRMKEGYLSAHYEELAEVRGGAISLKDLSGEDRAGMVVSGGRSFPGVQERVTVKGKKAQVMLMAQQLVPTSYTLNTERDNQEKLPSFNTESLHGKYTPIEQIELKAMVGHYSYRQLPDKVAFESARLGNRVNGEVAPGAQFKSGFDGYFWSGYAKGEITPSVAVFGELGGIVNNEADASDRDGQLWGIGPEFNFGSTQIIVEYGQFYLESDATVAYYTSSSTGNTNREGQFVNLIADFKESNFKLLAQWATAEPIISNGTQKTFNEYFIKVESHYASF